MLELLYGTDATNDADNKSDLSGYTNGQQANSMQTHAFLNNIFANGGVLAIYNNRVLYLKGSTMARYRFATPPVYEDTIDLTAPIAYDLNGSVFQYGKYVYFGQSRGDQQLITRVNLTNGAVVVYPVTPVTKGMFCYYEGYLYITGGFIGTALNDTKLWRLDVSNPSAGWVQVATFATKLPTVIIGSQAYLYNGRMLFCGGGKVVAGDVNNNDGNTYTVIPQIDLGNYSVSSITSTIALRNDYHNATFINGTYLSQYVYNLSGGNTSYIGVNLVTGQARTSNLGNQLPSYHSLFFQQGELGIISGGYGGKTLHTVRLPKS